MKNNEIEFEDIKILSFDAYGEYDWYLIEEFLPNGNERKLFDLLIRDNSLLYIFDLYDIL